MCVSDPNQIRAQSFVAGRRPNYFVVRAPPSQHQQTLEPSSRQKPARRIRNYSWFATENSKPKMRTESDALSVKKPGDFDKARGSLVEIRPFKEKGKSRFSEQVASKEPVRPEVRVEQDRQNAQKQVSL